PQQPETVSFEFTGGPQVHSAKIRVATRDRSFHCDPIDGRFPDWTTIIPKAAPTFTIKVNPTYLANLLTAVSHMLGDENQNVTLCFWKPDVPMAVVAKDAATGLCLDGLLMPLTDACPVRQYEPKQQTEKQEAVEPEQEGKQEDTEEEGGSDAS